MGARTQHSSQSGSQTHLKAVPGPDSGPADGMAPIRATLQSWKEIASELNRGVRTVQRWERNLGLPVRRVGKGSRCPVFAFKDELDGWLRSNTEARSAGNRDNEHHKALGIQVKTKPDAGLLQTIKDFFAPARSSHNKKNCDQCQGQTQYLEIHFWIHGTRRKWRMSVPFCPVCNADGRDQLRRSQNVQ
jgi:hypothetical protein